MTKFSIICTLLIMIVWNSPLLALRIKSDAVKEPAPEYVAPTKPTAGQLYEAAAIGNLPEVEKILQSGVDVNSTATDSVQTALMAAAMRGRLATVQYLHTKGATIDALDRNKHTALTLAIQKSPNALDIIKYLIEKAGADITHKVGSKDIFELAQESRNAALIDYINSKRSPMTNFIDAAKRADLGAFQKFLKQGININEQDENGDTVLHHVLRDNINFPEPFTYYLIMHGADPRIKNKSNQTALDIGTHHGHILRQSYVNYGPKLVKILESTPTTSALYTWPTAYPGMEAILNTFQKSEQCSYQGSTGKQCTLSNGAPGICELTLPHIFPEPIDAMRGTGGYCMAKAKAGNILLATEQGFRAEIPDVGMWIFTFGPHCTTPLPPEVPRPTGTTGNACFSLAQDLRPVVRGPNILGSTVEKALDTAKEYTNRGIDIAKEYGSKGLEYAKEYVSVEGLQRGYAEALNAISGGKTKQIAGLLNTMSATMLSVPDQFRKGIKDIRTMPDSLLDGAKQFQEAITTIHAARKGLITQKKEIEALPLKGLKKNISTALDELDTALKLVADTQATPSEGTCTTGSSALCDLLKISQENAQFVKQQIIAIDGHIQNLEDKFTSNTGIPAMARGIAKILWPY